MLIKMLSWLMPNFMLCFDQTTYALTFDGISGVPETDNTAFRIRQGFTAASAATYKSGYKVVKFLGGFLFIGNATPSGTIYPITVCDMAKDQATGILYYPSGGKASTTWTQI